MAGKTAKIEIAAQKLSQLFNSLDPSPFAERDLDPEAEAFIGSWAKELGPCDHYCVVIHLPKAEIDKAGEQRLRKAFSNYFVYRSQMLERAERECLRKGRRFLLDCACGSR